VHKLGLKLHITLERTLVGQVSEIAWQKGVSVETLVNLWIQEKVKEELAEISAAA
jgi:hypothetical protein